MRRELALACFNSLHPKQGPEWVSLIALVYPGSPEVGVWYRECGSRSSTQKKSGSCRKCQGRSNPGWDTQAYLVEHPSPTPTVSISLCTLTDLPLKFALLQFCLCQIWRLKAPQCHICPIYGDATQALQTAPAPQPPSPPGWQDQLDPDGILSPS